MSKMRATLLSADPIVVYSGMYAAEAKDSSFWRFGDAIKHKDATIMMLVAWTAEYDSDSAVNICKWRSEYIKEHPKHRLIFLTNTRTEQTNLNNLGAETFFLNHNVFVDRSLFKPLNDVDSKFDAIYNGQFLPFKRHNLAKNIPSLAIIGYNFDTDYFIEIKKDMSHAKFLNLHEDGSVKWMTQSEVNFAYNQSAVGLCLSKAEGAMHASMEYLLSGLPIITTASVGGRDYFFDGRFVQWCPDDPIAIAKAVDAFVLAKFDRNFIRAETLRKIDQELSRFQEALDNLLQNSSLTNRIISSWDHWYNDKLIVPKDYDQLLSQLV